MNPLFLAIRAISSEFARRIYLPLVWVAGSVLALVVIIASWLVTMSAWWLILLIPAILISVVFIIVAVIAGLVWHINGNTGPRRGGKLICFRTQDMPKSS